MKKNSKFFKTKIIIGVFLVLFLVGTVDLLFLDSLKSSSTGLVTEQEYESNQEYNFDSFFNQENEIIEQSECNYDSDCGINEFCDERGECIEKEELEEEIPEEEPIGQQCRDELIPYEEQESYLDTEIYTEKVPYIDQECENKKLSYKVENFKPDSKCINFDERCWEEYKLFGGCKHYESYCVKKEIYTPLDITNLDSEKGSWILQYSLFTNGNLKETYNKDIFLYPSETKKETHTFILSGEEEVNKKLTAYWKILSVPTKQVCTDVTKYKDEQKSREIIKYRPVIKYRTEQVCE